MFIIDDEITGFIQRQESAFFHWVPIKPVLNRRPG
jgi:hypothetical protein